MRSGESGHVGLPDTDFATITKNDYTRHSVLLLVRSFLFNYLATRGTLLIHFFVGEPVIIAFRVVGSVHEIGWAFLKTKRVISWPLDEERK